jgi:hypothetical protein
VTGSFRGDDMRLAARAAQVVESDRTIDNRRYVGIWLNDCELISTGVISLGSRDCVGVIHCACLNLEFACDPRDPEER